MTIVIAVVVIAAALSIGGLIADFFSGDKSSTTSALQVTSDNQPLCKIVIDDTILNKPDSVRIMDVNNAGVQAFYKKEFTSGGITESMEGRDKRLGNTEELDRLKRMIASANAVKTTKAPNGINPAVVLATYAKEGHKISGQIFGVIDYASNFDDQLKGTVQKWTSTIEGEGSWKGRVTYPDKQTEGIFERWHRSYTPMTDPRNKDDLKNMFAYLKMLLPADSFKMIRANDCIE